MRIYYRGYLIIKEFPEEECRVQGKRPAREPLAFEHNPRAAMRWIDRDVIRQRVKAAGWLTPGLVAA